jgi:hypothetical protein
MAAGAYQQLADVGYCNPASSGSHRLFDLSSLELQQELRAAPHRYRCWVKDPGGIAVAPFWLARVRDGSLPALGPLRHTTLAMCPRASPTVRSIWLCCEIRAMAHLSAGLKLGCAGAQEMARGSSGDGPCRFFVERRPPPGLTKDRVGHVCLTRVTK